MSTANKIRFNVKQAVPFFAVTDLEQSLHFYVDGLGFEVTYRWIDEGKLRWCWLQLGGAALMLQEYEEQQHLAVRNGQVGVSIYFISEDALEIYRDVKSRGIDAKTPFVGNGMWVTELTDPDGYKLFFESPTDAPEGKVFSG